MSTQLTGPAGSAVQASDEIEAIQKSIDLAEKKVAAIEKPIRWLTKVEAWRLGRRW